MWTSFSGMSLKGSQKMSPLDIFGLGMTGICIAYCLLPVLAALTSMLVEIIQAARGTK